MSKSNSTPSFEKAFARLEEILELVQQDTVSLEKSLNLYEEANTLLNTCTSQLSKAEQKVEMLMKSREGQLATNNEGEPLREELENNE